MAFLPEATRERAGDFWTSSRAFFRNPFESLRQPRQRITVGRHMTFQRGRLDDEFRALFQGIDEFGFLGLVLDPGVGALGNESEAGPGDFRAAAAFFHRKPHDDRDLLADILAWPVGDEDIGGIAFQSGGSPVLGRRQRVADLGLFALREKYAPVAVTRQLRGLPGLCRVRARGAGLFGFRRWLCLLGLGGGGAGPGQRGRGGEGWNGGETAKNLARHGVSMLLAAWREKGLLLRLLYMP